MVFVLQRVCIFIESLRVLYGSHLASVLISHWYKRELSILN